MFIIMQLFIILMLLKIWKLQWLNEILINIKESFLVC